jgi:hypothetical protein
LNPDEISSPVDLRCWIPAKCALFAQLMRESRKPEDSLVERNGFELPVPVVLSARILHAQLPEHHRKLLLKQYTKVSPVEFRSGYFFCSDFSA